MTSRRLWLAVLATAAVLRLLTLSAYPLHDSTEARYAEIARLMVVSGDWITPQIELGVPFWAKPPLSTWTTAASFELLGFGEFAARLPAFLLTMLTTALVFVIGRKLFSVEAAIASCAIFLTSIMGFVAAGAVMTDAALTLSTTLSLVAFWMSASELQSRWRYVFFVGLALGLLAKGPIALVLVGLPILAWSFWHKSIAWLWRAVPWVTGCILMLAIAGPWFWLAEIRTPGFLEYFLIGEHWLRFVESGWQGDLYGYAHPRPRGTIWLYGIAAALPWFVVAVYAVGRAIGRDGSLRLLTPVQAFLLLWALAPLVFFTFAGNILGAYVLPGMPAFALLLGDWVSSRSRSLARAGWLIPGVIAVATMSGLLDVMAYRSQRDLVEYHFENSPSSNLYYFGELPHSASFYSSGAAKAVSTKPALLEFLESNNEGFIAVRMKYADELPDKAESCLRAAHEIGHYFLLEKRGRCELQY